MQKMTKKTPLVFYIGIALLCLVLFSTHLTTGLYARYTSEASSQDSARVAKFDVTNSVDMLTANIDLDFFNVTKLTDDFKFTVGSNSEVAVTYDVVVTMPVGMAYYDWLELKLDGNSVTTVEENVFTFSNVNVLAAGGISTGSHTLTFSIKPAYQGNPGALQDVKAGTVLITVRAEQVD